MLRPCKSCNADGTLLGKNHVATMEKFIIFKFKFIKNK